MEPNMGNEGKALSLQVERNPNVAPPPSHKLRLHQDLLDEQHNIREMRSLHLSRWRYILFVVSGVLLCGVPFLLYKWFLSVRLLLYSPATFDANTRWPVTHVLAITKDSTWSICNVVVTVLPDNALFTVGRAGS
jgi:hypothetical protein